MVDIEEGAGTGTLRTTNPTLAITWPKDGAFSQRTEESLQVYIATVVLSEPCSRNISKVQT